MLRKWSEIKLRKRIKNVCWEFDDLLHFDDKVIKKTGLNINNYLVSPNVSMQQLIKTYFIYNHKIDCVSNNLLFSEKYLCNNVDLETGSVAKICSRKIENLNKRIQKSSSFNTTLI